MQPRYMTKAAKAIKQGKPIAQDVASELCQILENVGHTLWFQAKLAERIKAEELAKAGSR